jgi:hypothetical protein
MFLNIYSHIFSSILKRKSSKKRILDSRKNKNFLKKILVSKLTEETCNDENIVDKNPNLSCDCLLINIYCFLPNEFDYLKAKRFFLEIQMSNFDIEKQITSKSKIISSKSHELQIIK